MVFDVASLTKVLVPVTLTMKLIDGNQINLDRRISRIIQSFGTYGKERITIRHLLTHSSGYAATLPFYRQIARADGGDRAGVMTSRGAVEMIYNEIYRAKLENLPGKVAKYSDIGFILLGNAIELLYESKSLSKKQYAGLKEWFGEFVDWLQTSKNGQEENAACRADQKLWRCGSSGKTPHQSNRKTCRSCSRIIGRISWRRL